VDYGTVVMVKRYKCSMLRKNSKVLWAVDGEKTIIVEIEWQMAKCWGKRLWVSELVK